ncbi:hypothetical protein DERP_013805 [Dermatophagoides pteronyssinus]|uniref:Uncharacterized protein n=1 Tax=Dermatophagoides pteronyssinus TaxID=6956 RepID=A0ABQ8JD61_DERPT|nr:hypothetical protein DERP_013805 [Dermatophagoides pteronyssinus]
MNNFDSFNNNNNNKVDHGSHTINKNEKPGINMSKLFERKQEKNDPVIQSDMQNLTMIHVNNDLIIIRLKYSFIK